MLCNVGSIRQVHARLIQEGYIVSEYTLRLWVKNGTLPAVYSGQKALISYAKVIEILTGALPCAPVVTVG